MNKKSVKFFIIFISCLVIIFASVINLSMDSFGSEKRISLSPENKVIEECNQVCRDIILPYVGSKDMTRVLSASLTSNYQCSNNYGDVNGDGKLDDMDIRIALNVLLSVRGFSVMKYPCADANSNGKINAVDIEKIIRTKSGDIGDYNMRIYIATKKDVYAKKEKIELIG